VGVTAFQGELKSIIAMIEEADSALYQAKNAGRNQVKAFLSSSPGLQV
jgi:PleD family two-component response regulator